MKALESLASVAPPSFAWGAANRPPYSVHTGPGCRRRHPAGPPRHAGFPVGGRSSSERFRFYLGVFRSHGESIREVSLQAKVAGYIQSQPAGRPAPT